MADTNFEGLVSQARRETIVSEPEASAGIFLVSWMAKAGLSISPWWSATRDAQLRNFWKGIDHLSGAIYTFTSRMTTIPFKIIARDQSNKEHVAEADEESYKLAAGAELGKGWEMFYSKFVEDNITQDNGAFAEIIGAGRPDGPIIGRPVTVRHLDSARCQRTGNSEFPVVFRDISGKLYKLHYTRVIDFSQMQSPIQEMYGVGFCPVSRCINVSQNLLDILVYKQEKLGSRPHRQILITQGGLDPEDVRSAFQLAENQMTNQGLTRYSKIVLTGHSTIANADLKAIELASLPDGFDEETSITLGMAAIALAFGMDARDLFPALTSGATRADALLQHIKQRGKGPGQMIQVTEQLFNSKYLPPYLKMEFDFQDDEQDRQIAEIKNVRMQRWNLGVQSGTLDSRTSREQMVLEGDLTQAQFDRLELLDGRLPDGTDVLNIFYSDNPVYSKYLDMGIDGDVLDVTMHNPEEVISGINEKLIVARQDSVNAPNKAKRWLAYQCVVALERLKKLYTVGDLSLEEQDKTPTFKPSANDGVEEQDSRTASGTRRVDNLAPNPNVQRDNMKPDTEDSLPKGFTPKVHPKGGGVTGNFFPKLTKQEILEVIEQRYHGM